MNTDEITPLTQAGLADYHCHCDYSVDARGSIAEYCEAALARGLAELCFTTHYDANPHTRGTAGFVRIQGEKKKVHPDLLAPYLDEVREAAAEYYPMGLSVKAGVEIGWYPGCEEATEKVLDRYDFDYVLCGIHEFNNLCFCSHAQYAEAFDGMSAEQVAESYFRQAVAAARSGLFHTIAHLEYYRKYGVQHFGEKILTVGDAFLPDLFEALVTTGTALEVNASAIRHGLNDYYPQVSTVNKARREGVSVLHIGSDAHRPDQVGYEFEVLSAIVPPVLGGCDA